MSYGPSSLHQGKGNPKKDPSARRKRHPLPTLVVVPETATVFKNYSDAERAGYRAKRSLCANATVTFNEVEEGDDKTQVTRYTYELGGCTNERRHGSAWCQSCSDAYRAESAKQ